MAIDFIMLVHTITFLQNILKLIVIYVNLNVKCEEV